MKKLDYFWNFLYIFSYIYILYLYFMLSKNKMGREYKIWAKTNIPNIKIFVRNDKRNIRLDEDRFK